MPEDKESLLNIINASGFLFQLRVEKEIRSLNQRGASSWEVVSREHRWVDPVALSERFIDLILQSNAARLIVECKRVQDATWVFLVDDGRIEMARARLFWTHLTRERGPVSGWDEFKFSVTSPESSFCVVRGQGENDTPMLERLAGPVLRSTEIVAGQELQIGANRPEGPAYVYIPAIVTNAKLFISRFESDKVDIQTGTLPDASFQPVPMIRFRKALSTTIAAGSTVTSLSKGAEEQQRTLFVINAESLKSILPDAEIQPFGSSNSSGKWPWD